MSEIMAGALQESKRKNAGRAVPGWQSSKPRMGAECPNRTQMAEQQAGNREAQPEAEGVERRNPAKA